MHTVRCTLRLFNSMRCRLLIPIFALYLLALLYFIRGPLLRLLSRKRYEIVLHRPVRIQHDFRDWEKKSDNSVYLPHPLQIQEDFKAWKSRDDSDLELKRTDFTFKNSENGSGYQAEARELLLVQVLFAHGLSSPSYLYPEDPNPTSVWKLGLGQLTEIGAMQSFRIGEQLRKIYQNFISSPTEEIHCMSSSSARCRDSAFFLLAAMAHKTLEDISVASELPVIVPINYTMESKDQYLPFLANCYVTDLERMQILLSPESQDFISQHQAHYKFWSKVSGQQIRTYEDAGKLFEILQIERKMNLIIPTWAKREWAQLRYQADMWYSFRFKTFVMQRLLAGPLMSLMIKKMQAKISDPNFGKKIHFYSGFRHSIALMLHSLGLFNNRMPPFSSYIAFELYRRRHGQDNLNEIRILFFNTTSTSPDAELPSPRKLRLPGCEEYCPLPFLIQSKKHLLNVNWTTECHSDININIE